MGVIDYVKLFSSNSDYSSNIALDFGLNFVPNLDNKNNNNIFYSGFNHNMRFITVCNIGNSSFDIKEANVVIETLLPKECCQVGYIFDYSSTSTSYILKSI